MKRNLIILLFIVFAGSILITAKPTTEATSESQVEQAEQLEPIDDWPSSLPFPQSIEDSVTFSAIAIALYDSAEYGGQTYSGYYVGDGLIPVEGVVDLNHEYEFECSFEQFNSGILGFFENKLMLICRPTSS